MKTLAIIFSIVGFMTFSSCNQNTDASAMLENPETRNEIYNATAGNHDMMTSFMESMQTDILAGVAVGLGSNLIFDSEYLSEHFQLTLNS